MPYPMNDSDRAWYEKRIKEFLQMDLAVGIACAFGTLQGILFMDHLSDGEKVERMKFFTEKFQEGVKA